MDTEFERKLLLGVSAATVASGALQAAVPQAVLAPLRADSGTTSRHLFGTIGMFMVCVGATLFVTLRHPPYDRRVVLWAGAQKAGAAAAVGLGVRRGVFSRLALAVASFDALSALLVLDYRRRLRP
jgi:hypothetical protein